MKPAPILVARSNGEILGANEAAESLLGPTNGTRCHTAVHARKGHDPVCASGCVGALHGGQQMDHGVVDVRGQPHRMVCSGAGDCVVVSLTPAATPSHQRVELSPREREVLQLAAAGLSGPRIARRLKISLATVRTHMEHIRDKTGARTRAQAVAWAVSAGVIN